MTLNKWVLLVSTIILTLSAFPAWSDYTLNAKQEYSIKIPVDDMVSISIAGDRIAQIFAKSNNFSLENDPKSGTVFLTNLRSNPYSLTFITEKGHKQALRLEPVGQGYTTQITFLSKNRNKKTRPTSWRSNVMTKIQLARQLGFYKTSEPIVEGEGFSVKLLGYRNFKDLRVRKYLISNSSHRKTLELKPQDFSFNYELLATKISHERLQPEESTTLYTVARR
jgi:hypothetical protein